MISAYKSINIFTSLNIDQPTLLFERIFYRLEVPNEYLENSLVNRLVSLVPLIERILGSESFTRWLVWGANARECIRFKIFLPTSSV